MTDGLRGFLRPSEIKSFTSASWGTADLKVLPMDTTAIAEKTIGSLVVSLVTHQKRQRPCPGNARPGEFPLAAKPSIVLHFLTNCNLDPEDLAKLEATCSFFRQPANFPPIHELSLAELAAFDMCQKRAIFKPMTLEQQEHLKQRCGGSWKLVLRFLLAGETCTRREKSQAVAGPGHSIVVTSDGAVYSFGCGVSGQLGLGTTDKESRPRLIKSLQGIRIIHAAVGDGRTVLTSDTGRVYTFGKDSFGDTEFSGALWHRKVTTPRLIESLNDIFVVQAAIGNFFTAVLSKEGRVYTLSWGAESKLGHNNDLNDLEPRPLMGALEDITVVQISTGYCYLLALACQPSGMSVYSVGCGLGGKLGHGDINDEKQPRLIEQFRALNLEPIIVAAGAWHAAVVGKDGRVCTWGWGHYGCLGHGNENCEYVPKVVEGLSNVKAVHVAAGDYKTSVVADNGDVYSFGCGRSSSLGLNPTGAGEQRNRQMNVMTPKLATTLKQMNERVVQMSLTNSANWSGHTLAITDSNKVYAFGTGNMGQLGVELPGNQAVRPKPGQVDINLG